MSVLVVGSVAYDSVVTPAGKRDDALGGSATYFAVSSSHFTPVSVVAVVGQDFLPQHVGLLESHGVDTSGLERQQGRTFRWAGVYGPRDVNTRETLETQLNVFANFSPVLSEEHRRHSYLFLANIDPELQLSVLSQMAARPKLVATDTMNFWIDGKSSSLRSVVEKSDVLFVNDDEARELTGEASLVRSARRIMGLGPGTVVIKRGEHGVLLFQGESISALPAFPLEHVVDPTGAGDSFAGGFMGYLAATGDLSPDGFRRAATLGTVMGSFAVESFSVDRLATLSAADIEARFRQLSDISHFPPLADGERLPCRDDSLPSL